MIRKIPQLNNSSHGSVCIMIFSILAPDTMSTLGKIPLMGCFEFINYYRLQFLSDALYLELFAKKHAWDVTPEFAKRAKEPNVAIVITDVKQNIVWTSAYFERLSGYDRVELVGRNPNVLQGKDTNPETKMQIRKQLEGSKPFEGVILNYTKTGEAYDCQLSITPIYNLSGNLVHFMAIEA